MSSFIVILSRFKSFHSLQIKRTAAPLLGSRRRQHHQKEMGNAARERTHHRPKGGGREVILSFGVVLSASPFLWGGAWSWGRGGGGGGREGGRSNTTQEEERRKHHPKGKRRKNSTTQRRRGKQHHRIAKSLSTCPCVLLHLRFGTTNTHSLKHTFLISEISIFGILFLFGQIRKHVNKKGH